MTEAQPTAKEAMSAINTHILDCAALRRTTIERFDGLDKRLNTLAEKFDDLNKLAWKVVGSIVAAIFTATLALCVQTEVNREHLAGEAKATADTNAAQRAQGREINRANDADLAAQQEEIIRRLDALQKHSNGHAGS
jgi:hypothetical protein